MSFNFNGKRFLVTGAGRGLGRGIVNALIEAGGEVYGLEVIKENLDSLVEELPKVHPIHVDLADWEATRREVDKLGPLDGLVNNAGVFQREMYSCLDADKDDIQRVISVNLLAVINVSQSVAKKMVEAGRGGSIVNISSITALKAVPGFMAYAATKGAVDMVTKGFAAELGPQKIRVNSINPNFIQVTEMSRPMMSDPAVKKAYADQTPMEMPSIQDIVGPVLHLLSDNSRAVTGTVNLIDGGCSSSLLPGFLEQA